ncbi:MAG: hypothetical protein KC442_24975 [Thermomicrobiales bacterium]|nr:hypothetical protein [Thermomicrobiales bacterium]
MLAGDAICQGLADGAALEGTYKAWLADSVASPSTRFVQSTGPYRRVDGVTIANNWADLTDGNLLAAINITETGQTAPSDDYRFAWSGVNTDGTAVGGNTNCNGWTSNASGSLGAIGFIDQTGWPWSQPDGAACGHYYRLYCFQQS